MSSFKTYDKMCWHVCVKFLTWARSTCRDWPDIHYSRQIGSWTRWKMHHDEIRQADGDEAEHYTTWRAGWKWRDTQSSQEVTDCLFQAMKNTNHKTLNKTVKDKHRYNHTEVCVCHLGLSSVFQLLLVSPLFK